MRAGRPCVAGVTERKSTPSAVTYRGYRPRAAFAMIGGTGAVDPTCTSVSPVTLMNVPLPSSETRTDGVTVAGRAGVRSIGKNGSRTSTNGCSTLAERSHRARARRRTAA